jgi:hypothetical protein
VNSSRPVGAPGLKQGMDLNVPIALKFKGIALSAGG